MSTRTKFELEFLLKTSIKVLENNITTPSGLSEWFADDVNVKGDVYSFIWDGSEEKARLLAKKTGSHIRFKWLVDEEDGENVFFEFQYTLDPLTKSLVFKVIDFAEEDELENAKQLWDSQINELKRHIGA